LIDAFYFILFKDVSNHEEFQTSQKIVLGNNISTFVNSYVKRIKEI